MNYNLNSSFLDLRCEMEILSKRSFTVLAVYRPIKLDIQWVGKDFTCRECFCHFGLGPDDEPKIMTHLMENFDGPVGTVYFLRYVVCCPGKCGEYVTIGLNQFPAEDDYKQVPRRVAKFTK